MSITGRFLKRDGFQRGGIVGAATIVDCVRHHESAWFSIIPYLYQFHLEGPENIFDGRVWVMPAAKFLAGLP